MFTSTFNSVLQSVYTAFRAEYIQINPQCNENDVERAFLYTMAPKLTGEQIDLIESIK